MNPAQIYLIQQVAARAGKSSIAGGAGTDPEGKNVALVVLGLLLAVATACIIAALLK